MNDETILCRCRDCGAEFSDEDTRILMGTNESFDGCTWPDCGCSLPFVCGSRKREEAKPRLPRWLRRIVLRLSFRLPKRYGDKVVDWLYPAGTTLSCK
jgi:hypothetical protein